MKKIVDEKLADTGQKIRVAMSEIQSHKLTELVGLWDDAMDLRKAYSTHDPHLVHWCLLPGWTFDLMSNGLYDKKVDCVRDKILSVLSQKPNQYLLFTKSLRFYLGIAFLIMTFGDNLLERTLLFGLLPVMTFGTHLLEQYIILRPSKCNDIWYSSSGRKIIVRALTCNDIR